MSNPLHDFQNALIVRNVVARVRVAMEHSSPEEMKRYLHDHPNADPKDHSVAKKDKGTSGGQGHDSSLADAEAAKSKARSAETDKTFDEMKQLKSKVDNANPSAQKKFDRAYDKLYEAGDKAAKAAEKLVKKYDNIGDGFKGEEKEQREAAVEMLHSKLKEWKSNAQDHHSKSDSMAHEKIRQAEQTHAYAQELEKWVRQVSKSLKGDHDVER